VESFGQETSAFTYDTDTGLYSVNPDYDKMNALFELPLDISKADDEAANNYFKERAEENEDEEDTDIITGDSDIDEWINAFYDAKDSTNAAWDKVLANSKEDASHMQISDVDENGYVRFTTPDGENEIQLLVKDWSYESGVEVFNSAGSDVTLEGTYVWTLTKNEDGTFTFKYYVPSIE
jgi:hypothetical protein